MATGTVAGKHEELRKGIEAYDQGLMQAAFNHLGAVIGPEDEIEALITAGADEDPNPHLGLLDMALYHRGLIHQNFTMNMEDACLSYNLALRIKPDFGQAYMNRGVARAGLGKHDEALEDCDKALELLAGDANLCAEIHFNKGSIHDEKREFEAAVAAYDTAIEMNPLAEKYRTNRGWAKRNLGDLDGALEDFEEAIAMCGGYDRLACSNKAMCLQDKEDFEGALAEWQGIVDEEGEDDPGPYKAMGELLQALDRTEEAIEMYEKSLMAGGGSWDYFEEVNNLLETLC